MTTPFPPQGSVQAGLILARLTGCLSMANGQPVADGIFREFTGELLNSILVPKSGQCPAFYYARNRDQSVLVINGATSISQCTDLFNGYGSTLGVPQVGARNGFLEGLADTVAAFLKERDAYTTVRKYLAGWSLGGAIAHLIPSRMQVAEFRTAIWSVDSFGAPRPGGTNVARTASAFDQSTRWMNDSDPIPLAPPRVLDWPLATAFFGVGDLLSFAQFVHGQGGRNLDTDGRITPAELPIAASLRPQGSILDWYFSLESQASNEHSIVTYITRLERATSINTGASAPRNNRVEPVVPLNHGHVNRVEQQVRGAIVHLERQQGMDPVSIPPTRRFRAVKLSGVWHVVMGDSMVAMPGSKKSARALARHANGFILSLQNKAYVNSDGLLGALKDYIDLASSPEGGFRPVMNTTLPTVRQS